MRARTPNATFIEQFVDAVTAKPLLEDLLRMKRARAPRLLRLRPELIDEDRDAA